MVRWAGGGRDDQPPHSGGLSTSCFPTPSKAASARQVGFSSSSSSSSSYSSSWADHFRWWQRLSWEREPLPPPAICRLVHCALDVHVGEKGGVSSDLEAEEEWERKKKMKKKKGGNKVERQS